MAIPAKKKLEWEWFITKCPLQDIQKQMDAARMGSLVKCLQNGLLFLRCIDECRSCMLQLYHMRLLVAQLQLDDQTYIAKLVFQFCFRYGYNGKIRKKYEGSKKGVECFGIFLFKSFLGFFYSYIDCGTQLRSSLCAILCIMVLAIGKLREE